MPNLLSQKQLQEFELTKRTTRCGLCPNNCELTINSFAGKKEKFITGNKCDKPIKKHNKLSDMNLYEYKNTRMFDYSPLTDSEATRGQIGLPRALNMFEHYPFWFTFFTSLKYQVIISPRSSSSIYEEGMQTIPSESLCYPAKLANGHVQNLINQGIKNIFYPSVIFEKHGNEEVGRGFNCPVVISYPEVIAKNMDDLQTKNVNFYHPFISMESQEIATNNLIEFGKELGISKQEIIIAANLAFEEADNAKRDIDFKGEEILKRAEQNDVKVIVLAGRPYHIDPEISHGIDRQINSYGMAVITEDILAKRVEKDPDLRVIDQWSYHSRLYKAATYIGKEKNIEIIQLNSFGCGIDAVTTDQVKEIIEHYNKVYTCLKIDEGSNLGAAKIRIRSLAATIKQRDFKDIKLNEEEYAYQPVEASRDLKKYTILIPQMSPFHFDLIETAVRSRGYDVKVLPEIDDKTIEYGLKYIHNDACYPAIVALGQLMQAIDKYDLDQDKIALLISQTGGGCRATNYIAMLRQAVAKAGYTNTPVISFSGGRVKDVNALDLDFEALKRIAMAVLYGDTFLRVVHRMRPYELNPGETDRLHQSWIKLVQRNIENGKRREFKQNIKQIIDEFDNIPIDENLKKPRVGIVGEILVKYHPGANNNLVGVIEENGGEAVIPDILDFVQYTLYSTKYVSENFSKRNRRNWKIKILIDFVEIYRKVLATSLEKSKHFDPIHDIYHTAQKASELLDIGNQSGEGWFLTGEMINLIEEGVPNIVCTQPFGCLPNHVTGKGMFKVLREQYDNANIVAIDYDPGASEINQVSRIKLMMSVAHKNILKEQEQQD